MASLSVSAWNDNYLTSTAIPPQISFTIHIFAYVRYGATQKSDTRLCNSVSFTNISNLCRKLGLDGCGDEQLKSISHMFNSEKCALGVLHMCCAGFGLFLFDFLDELKSIYICCRYYAFTWPFLNRCFFLTFDSYQKYNTYQRCMHTYLVFSIYITEIRDSGEIIIAKIHRPDEKNFFKMSLVIFLIAHQPMEESTFYQARNKLLKLSHSRLFSDVIVLLCHLVIFISICVVAALHCSECSECSVMCRKPKLCVKPCLQKSTF